MLQTQARDCLDITLRRQIEHAPNRRARRIHLRRRPVQVRLDKQLVGVERLLGSFFDPRRHQFQSTRHFDVLAVPTKPKPILQCRPIGPHATPSCRRPLSRCSAARLARCPLPAPRRFLQGLTDSRRTRPRTFRLGRARREGRRSRSVKFSGLADQNHRRLHRSQARDAARGRNDQIGSVPAASVARECFHGDADERQESDQKGRHLPELAERLRRARPTLLPGVGVEFVISDCRWTRWKRDFRSRSACGTFGGKIQEQDRSDRGRC